MPYTLSEQEKQALRERYLNNINTINEYLPDHLRIRPDLASLNKRLNDPKEQRLYKKGLELKERETRRMELYDRLADKYRYLRSPDKTYVMDRVIYYQLEMSDDPNAQAYNENLIANYYLHPEAMAQQEFGKVLHFDPSIVAQISKSDDMPNMLMDFYETNAKTCEYAYSLKGALRNLPNGMVNEATKQCVESTASCYEMLESASDTVKSITEGSFFCVPTLNPEQINHLEGTDFSVDHKDIYDDMATYANYRRYRDMADSQYKTFFKKAQKKGYDLYQKGGFNKLIAKEVKPDGTKTNIAFANALEGQYNDVKVEYSTLDDEQVSDVYCLANINYIKNENFVQNDFEPAVIPTHEDKMKALRFQYAATTGLPMHKVEGMTLKDMIARHKGGFFERTFDTTSQEFKNVMETANNYYDPNSDDYQSDYAMTRAAQNYLTHKGVSTIADALRLDETGKGRALLCLAITASLPDKLRNPGFEHDYVKIPPKPAAPQNNEAETVEKSNKSKKPAIPDAAAVQEKPPKIDVVVKEAEPEPTPELNNDEPKL